jgi:hypothetical protein
VNNSEQHKRSRWDFPRDLLVVGCGETTIIRKGLVHVMKSVKGTVLMVAVAALILSALLPAQDDESPKNTTTMPATVIAHLPLPQATGSQMFLQKDDGRSYLYVQQASKQGFMIVDVTKPEFPSLLKRSAEVSKAMAGNLQMVTSDLAIASAPEKKPMTLASSAHPAQNIRILDLTDPRNPRTVEEFTGVTSVLPDATHSLIFLTNNEGLYVLSYQRKIYLPPSSQKKPCTSYSELQAMPPDCG